MNEIKQRRLSSGFTQSELSEKLGLRSGTTIAKWETGASKPRIEVLQKMAQLFGCTIDELLK